MLFTFYHPTTGYRYRRRNAFHGNHAGKTHLVELANKPYEGMRVTAKCGQKLRAEYDADRDKENWFESFEATCEKCRACSGK